MASLFWSGQASAVAMVAKQTFGTYDATTTRTITIGGVAVSRADTGGNLMAALTAFASLLAASTHPYFERLTWTSTATEIIATAKIAGIPFVHVGSVAGGTGTVSNSGVQAVTTANAGPNDWSTIANWYTALGTPSSALPASGDTVIFKDNSIDVRWGLTTGVTGVTLIRIEQTYTGKIGLDFKQFVTASDGSGNSSYSEYRACYLAIGCASWRIGDAPASGSPSGSSRLMIDVGATTTATIQVINSCQNSADSNRPCIRLLGAQVGAANTHVLNVRSAPGGIGIASEIAGETSFFLTVNISDTSSSSKVTSGPGLTVTTWIQSGGNNVLFSNQTVTTITCKGGTLRTEGTGATTTLNCYGGTVNSNNTGTTATINLQGGTVSGLGSGIARTWSTLNWYPESTISIDPAVVTLSAVAFQRQITVSSN